MLFANDYSAVLNLAGKFCALIVSKENFYEAYIGSMAPFTEDL